MSPFISNSRDMKEFGRVSLLRFYDRGFSMHLKKDPDDYGDD